MKRETLAAGVLLSILAVSSVSAVVGTVVGVRYASYWSYASSFDGICGPHAPDIQAHPCAQAEYLAEYNAGFAGVGAFLLDLVLLAGCSGSMIVLWGLGAGLVVLRKRSGPRASTKASARR